MVDDDDSATPWYLDEVLEELEKERLHHLESMAPATTQACDELESTITATSQDAEDDFPSHRLAQSESGTVPLTSPSQRNTDDIPRSYYFYDEDNSEFDLIFRPYHGPLFFNEEDHRETVTERNSSTSMLPSSLNVSRFRILVATTTATVLFITIFSVVRRCRECDSRDNQKQNVVRKRKYSNEMTSTPTSNKLSNSSKRKHCESHNVSSSVCASSSRTITAATTLCKENTSTTKSNHSTRYHDDDGDNIPSLEQEEVVIKSEGSVHLSKAKNICDDTSDVKNTHVVAKSQCTNSDLLFNNSTQDDEWSRDGHFSSDREELVDTSEKEEALCHLRGFRGDNDLTNAPYDTFLLQNREVSVSNEAHSTIHLKSQQLQEKDCSILFTSTASSPTRRMTTNKKNVVTSTISYAEQVHMIASTVSSTGLNHQESLKLANEVIMKRLEYQYQSKERQTQDQYQSIIKEWESELNKLKYMRYQLFPGSIFWYSTWLSFVSRVIWQQRHIIFKLLFHNSNQQPFASMALDIMDIVCSCSTNSSIDDYANSVNIDSPGSSLLPMDSLYITRQIFSLSMVHGFTSTLSSIHTSSQILICRLVCITRIVIIPFIVLYMIHRILGAFRSRNDIHTIVNSSFMWLWLLPNLLGNTNEDYLLIISSKSNSSSGSRSSVSSLLYTHLFGISILHMIAAYGLHMLLNGISRPQDLQSSTKFLSGVMIIVKCSTYFVSIMYGIISAAFLSP